MSCRYWLWSNSQADFLESFSDCETMGGMTTIVSELGVRLITCSPEVEEAFTEGDCWLLALAIEDLTGFPLVLLGYEGVIDDSWVHAMNMLPNGLLLDIRGITTASETVEYFRYGLDVWTEYYHKSVVIAPPVDRNEAFYDIWQMFPKFSPKKYAKRTLKELGLERYMKSGKRKS